jgi:hypothetical protein
MTNPKDISEKLIQIRHDAGELQSRLTQISTAGLNDEEQSLVLVSLAKTYRDIIDMLKKNSGVSFDELKRKGVQALDNEPGTVTLHGIESYDSVKVRLPKSGLGPQGPGQMSTVVLNFYD